MESVLVDRPSSSSQNAIGRIGCWLLLAMPLSALFNVYEVTTIGGLNIRPSDVVFLMTGLVWALWTGIRTRISKYEFRLLWCLLLLVFFPGLASAALEGYAVDWPRWMRFIQTMTWGIFALAFVTEHRVWMRFINVTAVSGGVIGLSSIVAFINNPEIHRVAGYISAGAGEVLEEQVSFNEIGALHAMVVVLLFARIFEGEMTKLAWIALILNLAGLVLVQSRSSYLALVVFILIYGALAVLQTAKLRRLRRGTILAVVSSAVVLIVLISTIAVSSEYLAIDRFQVFWAVLGDESVNIRLWLWDRGLDLLAEASLLTLLFGYGSDSLAVLISAPTVDNFFLDHVLSEGLVGLVLIIAVVFWPLIVRDQSDRRDRKLCVLGVACVAIVVSLTGNVLVNPYYGAVTMIVLWGSLSSRASDP